jgi:hypothetical protein
VHTQPLTEVGRERGRLETRRHSGRRGRVQRQAIDPQIEGRWRARDLDHEVERDDAIERELRGLSPTRLGKLGKGDVEILVGLTELDARGEVTETPRPHAGAALGLG